MKTPRKIRMLAGAFLSASLLSAAPPPTDEEGRVVSSLVQALSAVSEYAADPASTEQLIYQGAIPSMLRRLDPHSAFFDPQQFEQLQQMQQSVQKGFGTVVSVLPGRVIVLQVLPETPSARAGMASGDQILGINGIPLAGLNLDQLIELLGMARQREARLAVKRPGNSRLMNLTLTPQSVESPSVDRAFLLRPGVGYIRIQSFDTKTGALVREKIEGIGGAGLKGLVIDLRENPGGVVGAALETAALFLQPGQRILSVKGRTAKGEDVDVPKDVQPYQFPVAVLVGEKTASASEIVAGALQDHQRATIVGQQTYGKGIVQSVFPLSGNTGMALTTAFYYTPRGRSIQRPLKDGALSEVTAKIDLTRTDHGGIRPDILARPEAPTRFHAVLEANGLFSTFAAEVKPGRPVEADFQVDSKLMDDFKVWLSERNIQPSLREWSAERDWVRSRLQQEYITLSLGVAKGDELELQRDQVVRAALEALSGSR